MPARLAATVLCLLLPVTGWADEARRTGDSQVRLDWTGCYVGIQAGGLFSRQEWLNRTPGGAFYGVSLGDHTASGWLAGGQAGCDYQFPNGVVLGVQGDYAWSDADGSHPSTRETGVVYGSDVTALASMTGRIGYSWDRVLAYVDAGAAWQRDDYWATTTRLGTAYRGSETRQGWTLGAGGEYALTELLSGFVGVRYYQFGSPEIGLTPQIAGLRRAYVDLDESTVVVRAGLNLRLRMK